MVPTLAKPIDLSALNADVDMSLQNGESAADDESSVNIG